MNEPISSPRLRARIAGLLYLIAMAGGMFAEFTRSSLFVSGDAAATARHILASEPLYRWSIAADLIAGASYVGVTALLYGLLRPVSRDVSLAAAFFSLVGCASGATLNLVAPLVLMGGAPYLAAFTPEQLRALARVFLSLHGQDYNISLFFFGFYCALLGYLVFRSGFMPRFVGVLLALAGLGWLADSLANLVWPALADHLDSYAMLSSGLGEGALCLWLLAVGVNAPKWRERAGAAA
ncbi:MAG: DUF4386 domain-containing protein [Pseudomonadota bacterium]|nr:DUF4386 domain-containing protein [Pseudomonadota bacterium]